MLRLRVCILLRFPSVPGDYIWRPPSGAFSPGVIRVCYPKTRSSGCSISEIHRLLTRLYGQSENTLDPFLVIPFIRRCRDSKQFISSCSCIKSIDGLGFFSWRNRQLVSWYSCSYFQSEVQSVRLWEKKSQTWMFQFTGVLARNSRRSPSFWKMAILILSRWFSLNPQ